MTPVQGYRFVIGTVVRHLGERDTEDRLYDRESVRYIITGHRTEVCAGGTQYFYLVRGTNRLGACDPTERTLHEFEVQAIPENVSANKESA